MSGPWYTELENNHHYILINERTGRSYYTPAQDDANEIAGILNNLEKRKRPEIFQIIRILDDGDRRCHVAFVSDEDFAFEFCEEHKDCEFYSISVSKYRLELESEYHNVPTCSNCEHYTEHYSDNNQLVERLCKLNDELVKHDDYCEDWELEE